MNADNRARRGTAVVLLLTLGWVGLRLPAQGATEAAYDGALAQVQSALSRQAEAVRHGTTLPAPEMPSAVAARVLTPIRSLERPGQAPQTVDSSLLIEEIRAAGAAGNVRQRASNLRTAAAQIAALRRDVISPGTAAAPAGAEDEVRAVLSARTYDSDPLPPPSLFDRFVAWLEKMLERLLRRRGPSVPDINPVFVKAIVIVLLAGVFALLVAVLVRWLRSRTARPQPLSLNETEAALVEARDTDSLRALAEQKAQQGDYRLALRFVYLALLVTLDTNGVLRFDRSKTNWEYLRSLRAAGRADVYDAMTPLTREFDRIWYGFASADAADYARALTQYDALQAASKSAPPVAA